MLEYIYICTVLLYLGSLFTYRKRIFSGAHKKTCCLHVLHCRNRKWAVWGCASKKRCHLKSDRNRDSLMSKFSPYHHDRLPMCQDKGVLVLLCTCHSDYIPLFLGCGQCWSFDGNWKLGFTHCMYPVTSKLEGFQQLRDVCTDEPKYGKAFCEHHCAVAAKNSIPCDLKECLKFKAGICKRNTKNKYKLSPGSFVQPDSLSISHYPVARSQGIEHVAFVALLYNSTGFSICLHSCKVMWTPQELKILSNKTQVSCGVWCWRNMSERHGREISFANVESRSFFHCKTLWSYWSVEAFV